MAQLIASFADFLTCGQDAVHGADRAVIGALVEQAGVDLGGGLVGEARRAQEVDHGLAFQHAERASRARPGPTHGRWPGEIGALTVDASARQAQGRAGASGQTGRRRQRDERVHHDSPSLSDVASGIPSSAATFFWISMIASACCSFLPSRAFSRLTCASSAAKGLRAAGLGPRLVGRWPPRAPLSRCRRQSDRADEYKPSRRRIAPMPPAEAAASVSAKIRSFVSVVIVRRRGRSESSGDAAVVAGTTLGLRPPSAPATTAASIFSVLSRITTMIVLRPQV